MFVSSFVCLFLAAVRSLLLFFSMAFVAYEIRRQEVLWGQCRDWSARCQHSVTG